MQGNDPTLFVRRLFGPPIAILASQDVDLVCKRNAQGTNIVNILQTFSHVMCEPKFPLTFATDQSSLPRRAGSTFITQLNLNFLEHEVFNLNNSGFNATRSNSSTAEQPPPSGEELIQPSDPEHFPIMNTTASIRQFKFACQSALPWMMPWFEAYRLRRFQIIGPNSHQIYNQPVACLIVVTTSDILNQVETLCPEKQSILPIPPYIDTNRVAIFHFLLHNANSGMASTQVQTIFSNVSKALSDAAALVTIYSSAITTTAKPCGDHMMPSPLNQPDNPSTSPETDKMGLSDEDRSSFCMAINKFIKYLLPHMQSQLQQANTDISRSRSRLLQRFSSLWSQSFPSKHSTPTSVVPTKISSPALLSSPITNLTSSSSSNASPMHHSTSNTAILNEQQSTLPSCYTSAPRERLLGDWCFMLGDYFDAYHAYMRIVDRYKEYGSHGIIALEMAAHCIYLMNYEQCQISSQFYYQENQAQLGAPFSSVKGSIRQASNTVLGLTTNKKATPVTSSISVSNLAMTVTIPSNDANKLFETSWLQCMQMNAPLWALRVALGYAYWAQYHQKVVSFIALSHCLESLGPNACPREKALIHEQLAFVSLLRPTPRKRHYAHQMVLAGNLNAQANRRAHALANCVAAYRIFDQANWYTITNYLERGMAQLSHQLYQHKLSLFYTSKRLRVNQQNAEEQNATLREFLSRVTEMRNKLLTTHDDDFTEMHHGDDQDASCNPSSPDNDEYEPLASPVLTIMPYVQVYAFYPRHDPPYSVWPFLTQALLRKMQLPHFHMRNLPKRTRNMPYLAIQGEPMTLRIQLINTFQIPIQLQDMQLRYRFECPEYDGKGRDEMDKKDKILDGLQIKDEAMIDDSLMTSRNTPGEFTSLAELKEDACQVPSFNYLFAPCESMTLGFQIIPNQIGKLCIYGIKFRLCGLIWVSLDLQEQVLANVAPSMPKLELTLNQWPKHNEAIYAGQMLPCELQITNSGKRTLNRLAFTSTHLHYFYSERFEQDDLVKDGEADEEDDQEACDTQARERTSKRRMKRLLAKLNSNDWDASTVPASSGGSCTHIRLDSPLGPGQTMCLPLWFRAALPGMHTIYLLFYFESLHRLPQDEIQYRLQRAKLRIKTLKSIKSTWQLRDDPSDIEKQILYLTIENVINENQDEDVQIELNEIKVQSMRWNVELMKNKHDQDVEHKANATTKKMMDHHSSEENTNRENKSAMESGSVDELDNLAPSVKSTTMDLVTLLSKRQATRIFFTLSKKANPDLCYRSIYLGEHLPDTHDEIAPHYEGLFNQELHWYQCLRSWTKEDIQRNRHAHVANEKRHSHGCHPSLHCIKHDHTHCGDEDHHSIHGSGDELDQNNKDNKGVSSSVPSEYATRLLISWQLNCPCHHQSTRLNATLASTLLGSHHVADIVRKENWVWPDSNDGQATLGSSPLLISLHHPDYLEHDFTHGQVARTNVQVKVHNQSPVLIIAWKFQVFSPRESSSNNSANKDRQEDSMVEAIKISDHGKDEQMGSDGHSSDNDMSRIIQANEPYMWFGVTQHEHDGLRPGETSTFELQVGIFKPGLFNFERWALVAHLKGTPSKCVTHTPCRFNPMIVVQTNLDSIRSQEDKCNLQE